MPSQKYIGLCRHCGEIPVNRPRGMCWTCYYLPGVRDLYPSTSKYARKGFGNGNFDAPLPVPTAERPNTEQKVLVMMMRAALGQQLFHPADATVGEVSWTSSAS